MGRRLLDGRLFISRVSLFSASPPLPFFLVKARRRRGGGIDLRSAKVILVDIVDSRVWLTFGVSVGDDWSCVLGNRDGSAEGGFKSRKAIYTRTYPRLYIPNFSVPHPTLSQVTGDRGRRRNWIRSKGM